MNATIEDAPVLWALAKEPLTDASVGRIAPVARLADVAARPSSPRLAGALSRLQVTLLGLRGQAAVARAAASALREPPVVGLHGQTHAHSLTASPRAVCPPKMLSILKRRAKKNTPVL